MKGLVVGLGNPILSDDGVGISVAQSLRGRIGGLEVVTTPLAGLGLLDLVAGYERLFVIDAFIGKENAPGEVVKLEGGDGALHLFTSHGLDFFEILRLGREMGYGIPEAVWVYGIAIREQVPFGEELSSELQERLASILETIIADISSHLAD